MADTDEASIEFAREADQATVAVQTDIDRNILDLAVENTNLKAQRLSFGPAQEEAEAFRDAFASVAPTDPAKDTWQVEALVARAVAAVREIQVLQAPHIAEPEEAAMTRVEERMATAEAAGRGALKALATLVQPSSRPQLAAATAAIDRFVDLNGQNRLRVASQQQRPLSCAVARAEANADRRV